MVKIERIKMDSEMHAAVSRVRKTLDETIDSYHPSVVIRNIITRQLHASLESVLENMALTDEQRSEYDGIYESIKKDCWESMMNEIINVRAGTGKTL
jgi:hypothetical protein